MIKNAIPTAGNERDFPGDYTKENHLPVSFNANNDNDRNPFEKQYTRLVSDVDSRINASVNYIKNCLERGDKVAIANYLMNCATPLVQSKQFYYASLLIESAVKQNTKKKGNLQSFSLIKRCIDEQKTSAKMQFELQNSYLKKGNISQASNANIKAMNLFLKAGDMQLAAECIRLRASNYLKLGDKSVANKLYKEANILDNKAIEKS